MKIFAAFLLGVSLLVAVAGTSAGHDRVLMAQAATTPSPSPSPSASASPYATPSAMPTY